MATQKPAIPKGTRDFGPREMIRRNYIFEIIEGVFGNYGYLPLETPAMENLSTLLGKYGEEGDRLLFKVLNSGNYLDGIGRSGIGEIDPKKLALLISEKGLRYDLTVPFARYVVQHRNEIVFPFKRYQIQPVWRADRPQKGRYREFYQCDVDVIGSDSLLNEVELMQIMNDVFLKLNIPVNIHFNNRKILAGIAEIIGVPEKIKDVTIALDKLPRIGLENVKHELEQRGISASSVEKLIPFLTFTGSGSEKVDFLKNMLSSSSVGMSGAEEVEQFFYYLSHTDIRVDYELDITLARGLDYYTGAIFEVIADEWQIGSICGGGRYDDLTGVFGLPGVSGVGVSFGADRIYDVMLNTNKFPDTMKHTSTVLFLNFGDEEIIYALSLIGRLREAGIPSELYPDSVRIRKQMNYANQKHIPYVVFIGEDEIKKEMVSLKVMATGEQVQVPFNKLVERLSLATG